MLLSLVLIVPFLLLAAAGIVMIGGETPRYTAARSWPPIPSAWHS